jgi:hypothetical protein
VLLVVPDIPSNTPLDIVPEILLDSFGNNLGDGKGGPGLDLGLRGLGILICFEKEYLVLK